MKYEKNELPTVEEQNICYITVKNPFIFQSYEMFVSLTFSLYRYYSIIFV